MALTDGVRCALSSIGGNAGNADISLATRAWFGAEPDIAGHFGNALMLVEQSLCSSEFGQALTLIQTGSASLAESDARAHPLTYRIARAIASPERS